MCAVASWFTVALYEASTVVFDECQPSVVYTIVTLFTGFLVAVTLTVTVTVSWLVGAIGEIVGVPIRGALLGGAWTNTGRLNVKRVAMSRNIV